MQQKAAAEKRSERPNCIVKPQLTVHEVEEQPNAPLTEKVQLTFLFIDARPKRRRTTYTDYQKELAQRILRKQGGSYIAAVRFLLLQYPELFPDMTESQGEKNLRLWAAAADKADSSPDFDLRNNLNGRPPVLSESCRQAIYNTILEQVLLSYIGNKFPRAVHHHQT